MRNLAELNVNEYGAAVTRPPPTVEVIRAFEAEFGRPLPEDYLAFLRFCNGGHPELDIFVPKGGSISDAYAVNHFLRLDDDVSAHWSLWHALSIWRPIVGELMLPFAETGTGDPFLLDFGTEPPCVAYCAHDDDFAIYDVAPSFEAFIDGLQLYPEES